MTMLSTAKLGVFLYDVENHRTVILTNVDNVGSLPNLWRFAELELLSQVMKVLEII